MALHDLRTLDSCPFDQIAGPSDHFWPLTTTSLPTLSRRTHDSHPVLRPHNDDTTFGRYRNAYPCPYDLALAPSDRSKRTDLSAVAVCVTRSKLSTFAWDPTAEIGRDSPRSRDQRDFQSVFETRQ